MWVNKDFVEPPVPPNLSSPKMSPASGDTETLFTFSVDYSHPDGDLPDSIQVVIDGNTHNMESTNGHYEYSTKLSEGNHTYYFTTTLGEFTVNTNTYNTGYISQPEGPPENGDGDDGEGNTMLYASIGIIVIFIVVLILRFIFLKKKGKEEEVPVEEAQPLPTEEVPPEAPLPEQPSTTEVPPEQVPIQETPPPEQPPTPEVPPEEVPAPEMLQPEQPPPTTEITPQAPQVAEQPPLQLAMPEVKEQPSQIQSQQNEKSTEPQQLETKQPSIIDKDQ